MANEIKVDVANEVADIDVIFNKVSADPKGAMKSYKRLSSNFTPKSIASMARDQIMQFPVYMSNLVNAEDAPVINKALEKQYSVLAMLALSNHLNYDSSKYQTVGDVISEIHNNNDNPNMLNYVMNLVDNTKAVAHAFESTRVQVNADDLAGLWYGTNDEITTESINNQYLPNEGNIRKAEASIAMAMEANSSAAKTEVKANPDFDPDKKSNAFTQNDVQKQAQQNVSPEPKKETGWDARLGSANYGTRGAGPNAKVPKPLLSNDTMLVNAAPTVVTATMVIDGEPRDFMIAIKAMCHVVPTQQMVSMLVDAVQNNQLAFKIIKWSKGEQHFVRDFIFDISNARANANNMKNAGAWTYALKRRKEASKAFVGGGSPVSPISTLVVTDVEVEAVKAACGIDISKDDVAAKLIKDYFLLAFMIYNTQTKAIMTMIDSDKSRGFVTTNINGLKAGNKKDTGLEAKDLIKLLGR